jgi:hypothetical protein
MIPRSDHATRYDRQSRHFFDYPGLVKEAGWVYPAWPDNSTSTSDNPDGVSRLDIRTARIAP